MSIKHKKLGAALLCVVAIGIAMASTAGATSQTVPGVTGTSVTIGGTFPLTEPPSPAPPNGASLYKTIAAAEQAYYHYVNTHGKVHGRTINDLVANDYYTPSETVKKVKQLVENDHVFAIVGSLGTAPGLATWNYLNNNGVPQVLLATGDAYWGTCTLTGSAFKPKPYCTKPKPWTIGWQPDYPGEAVLYAKYILNHQPSGGAKIGILYQDDPYGKNYLDGFKKGLGAQQGKIVHTEAYSPAGESAANIIGRMGSIKASGANVVVIFATPGTTITSLVGLKVLGWNHGGGTQAGPVGGVYLNNVSANRIFLLKAEQNGALVNGVISTSYVKSQTKHKDAAMALGKAIIAGVGSAQLNAQWKAGDANLVYGLAVAYTVVDALKHAGSNLTRASFMKAIRNLNETGATKNPWVYPGMAVKTCLPCSTKPRTFPMEQLIFEKWSGQTNSTTGDWGTFGSVLNSGH